MQRPDDSTDAYLDAMRRTVLRRRLIVPVATYLPVAALLVGANRLGGGDWLLWLAGVLGIIVITRVVVALLTRSRSLA